MGNTINVQGSYIDIHDNENVYLSVDKAEVKMGQETKEREAGVPEELNTAEAKQLWAIAQEQGWVDEGYQPVGLSRPLSAVLADRMATKLGIANKWKVFEQLWHRKNMRNDYNEALDQKQYGRFLEKLRNAIG